MISYLEGRLLEAHDDGRAVIVCAGVGYGVRISARTLEELPAPGGETRLWIYTAVREDAIELFGFHDPVDRELFLLLITVDKVGPKAASALLSGAPAGELAAWIAAGDVARLTTIKGIGKKLAGDICHHLGEKVGAFLDRTGLARASGMVQKDRHGPGTDAISALVNLGYREAEAARAVQAAISKLGDGTTTEAAVKEALAQLRPAREKSA